MDSEEKSPEQLEVIPAATSYEYAGFWMRFAAAFIDWAILSVAGMILVPLLYLLGIVGALFGAGLGALVGGSEGAAISAFGAALLVVFLAGLLINWLYYALMERSKLQGTLGKMALGIIVVDENGERITFDRATKRYFAKYLSGLIFFIGFVMAAFTQRKQALHDIMAGCLVVEKSAPPKQSVNPLP